MAAAPSNSPAVVAPPDVLLHTIGQALVDTLNVSVLSNVVIEATPEFAGSIWKAWDARADDKQKRRELAALARTPEHELEDVVDGVVRSLGLGPRGEQTESVFAYLSLVPAMLRRQFRRPSSPLGTTLPARLPLYGSWDLLPLLPARMPKFQPGDRPWNIGDWELRELIELRGWGEVWKAVNPRGPDRPPVALHFFTNASATRHIRETVAPMLDRVLIQGRLPGVIPLQEIYLFADPPCVQMPYLQAADLASLVLEARETQVALAPAAVADLVLQIAETLGPLHAIRPAIVHRDLRGPNILLMTDATGRRRSLLANLGLGALLGAAAHGEEDVPLMNACASPEQLRGDPARPHDDIYALGVLWYQLLEGDLGAVGLADRRGGAGSRRRHAGRIGRGAGILFRRRPERPARGWRFVGAGDSQDDGERRGVSPPVRSSAFRRLGNRGVRRSPDSDGKKSPIPQIPVESGRAVPYNRPRQLGSVSYREWLRVGPVEATATGCSTQRRC